MRFALKEIVLEEALIAGEFLVDNITYFLSDYGMRNIPAGAAFDILRITDKYALSRFLLFLIDLYEETQIPKFNYAINETIELISENNNIHKLHYGLAAVYCRLYNISGEGKYVDIALKCIQEELLSGDEGHLHNESLITNMLIMTNLCLSGDKNVFFKTNQLLYHFFKNLWIQKENIFGNYISHLSTCHQIHETKRIQLLLVKLQLITNNNFFIYLQKMNSHKFLEMPIAKHLNAIPSAEILQYLSVNISLDIALGVLNLGTKQKLSIDSLRIFIKELEVKYSFKGNKHLLNILVYEQVSAVTRNEYYLTVAYHHFEQLENNDHLKLLYLQIRQYTYITFQYEKALQHIDSEKSIDAFPMLNINQADFHKIILSNIFPKSLLICNNYYQYDLHAFIKKSSFSSEMIYQNFHEFLLTIGDKDNETGQCLISMNDLEYKGYRMRKKFGKIFRNVNATKVIAGAETSHFGQTRKIKFSNFSKLTLIYIIPEIRAYYFTMNQIYINDTGLTVALRYNPENQNLLEHLIGELDRLILNAFRSPKEINIGVENLLSVIKSDKKDNDGLKRELFKRITKLIDQQLLI